MVAKSEYLKGHLSGLVTNYFESSSSRMAAFFARENVLDLDK